MGLDEDALDYHRTDPPGKIEISTTKPTNTQRDLSLAYSPGVAAPCTAIDADETEAYTYTAKGNLVGVVSNGSAVLGLGDIGAQASKPVMEGKGVLFKRFADIDVFDVELDEADPDKIVEAVKMMEPTFGGSQSRGHQGPGVFHRRGATARGDRHPRLPRRPARDSDHLRCGPAQRRRHRRQGPRGPRDRLLGGRRERDRDRPLLRLARLREGEHHDV